MPETWWSAAPLAFSADVDAPAAVVDLARSLLWGGVDAPVGLLLCVLTPGLDGSAVRAALLSALPSAPIVVLQAAAAVVGGEVVRQGAGLLLGQWHGEPAVVRIGPASGAAAGPRLCFGGAGRDGAVAGAAGGGLVEPMGAVQIALHLPSLLEAALRIERGAEPIGPVLRAGQVIGGQIGALDGDRASSALSRLGAALPAADRGRLRAHPLLLGADAPAWAVGGVDPLARVLGVHEGQGALLVDRPVEEGARVQLGVARPRSLARQLATRPLRAAAPRVALWFGPPRGTDASGGEAETRAADAEVDALASLQLELGPTLLFGLQADVQRAHGLSLSGCDVLVVLDEPDWS